MTIKSIGSQVTGVVRFKKMNPLKWADLQEHFKSLEISQFGQGEATTQEGGKSPALAAIHKDGQIVYTPQARQLIVAGTELDSVLKLFGETIGIAEDIIGSPERMKANVAFYEIEVKAEVEPELATPLEIMHYITPPGLFQPFEDALSVGSLDLFLYRFYHTPSEVDQPVRSVVPWYDLQFFPVIENPDRFLVWVVCRDYGSEIAMRRAAILYSRCLEFLSDKEKEVGR